MNSKTIILGTLFFSLLLVVGAYFIFNNTNKAEVKVLSYSANDKEKPIAVVNETFKDLGKIKVSDTKETTFVVKNSGTKPLQLSNISSSCGCTAGQIIYNGVKSREYSMHAQSDDVFEIAPQTEATVNVIYRPFTMPVYGLVEREVYISTNDPSNAKLAFKVKAIVN